MFRQQLAGGNQLLGKGDIAGVQGGAGSVTLTVTLSDDYTETRPIDCEVNEGAIDDTK